MKLTIYCWYQYWWSNYLLLISVLMKWLSTADISIDEVTIYCWYQYWCSNYLLLLSVVINLTIYWYQYCLKQSVSTGRDYFVAQIQKMKSYVCVSNLNVWKQVFNKSLAKRINAAKMVIIGNLCILHINNRWISWDQCCHSLAISQPKYSKIIPAHNIWTFLWFILLTRMYTFEHLHYPNQYPELCWPMPNYKA